MTSDLLQSALAQHQAGQLAAAEAGYRQVLTQSPNSSAAWHLLGALCLQSGRHQDAINAISRAIQLEPGNADYHNHLGAAYGAAGDKTAAIASLRRAVQLAPQSGGAHYNLGTALRNDEQLTESVVSFQNAIAAGQPTPEMHFNLGNSFRELKQFEQAEASFRAALRLRPQYAKAMVNLGNVLRDQDRLAEGIQVLRGAVAAHPEHANAHLNLGTLLRDAGEFNEAVIALRRAATLDPRSADVLNNLGTALQARAEFAEAAACYEAALAANPNLPEAHFSIGTHLLRQGNLAAGFAEFDWRWRCKSFSTQQFPMPQWDGSPLAGRTILLYAEQGLGDAIHFVRYAAGVKARGGRTLVQLPEAVLPLLKNCPGIDERLPAGLMWPAFDAHCPLMSLPGVLELSLDELWHGPYLTAEPARIEAWRDKLAPLSGFRIGVCWQGNPKHLFDSQRSFPLTALAPIANQPGVQLVSLQKGFGAEQIADWGFEVFEPGGQGNENLDQDGAFLDTAAILSSLDLLISADSAAAHVAGGLGRPVWLALSAHSDWRWFADRTDSPWYPATRLFRQAKLDQWDDVFRQMAAELPGLLAAEPSPGSMKR